MFKCFSNCLSAISMKSISSSASHRKAQRINAGAEVMGEGLENFSPSLIIPTKFAQAMVSGYSIFSQDTYITEKIVHAVQFGISAAQVGLAIALLFEGAECVGTNSSTLCNAVLLTDLLYKGTLLSGWLPSEISKDPATDPTLPPQPSQPAQHPLPDASPHTRHRVRMHRAPANNHQEANADNPDWDIERNVAVN